MDIEKDDVMALLMENEREDSYNRLNLRVYLSEHLPKVVESETAGVHYRNGGVCHAKLQDVLSQAASN